MRFDPATKKTSIFTDNSGKANGLIFDARGGLVACEGSDEGGRRLSRWDVKTGERTTLVDRFARKALQRSERFDHRRARPDLFHRSALPGQRAAQARARAVYRLDPDGRLVELTREVEKPNGIAISPDQKTLYVADTNNGSDRISADGPKPTKGAMKVYAFPLDTSGAIAAHGARSSTSAAKMAATA